MGNPTTTFDDVIDIAVVEDNDLYRSLLRDICENCDRLNLVGDYASMRAARAALEKVAPDIVLVDLKFPDGNGVDLIKHLRQINCHSECLALTVYDDDKYLFPALEAGAVGYLLKDQVDEETLVAALRDTAQGGAPMSASIARRVLGYFLNQSGGRSTSPALTARENEIMEKLALGYSARTVAQLLHISYQTVRCHQKNIYKKLQVGSVLEALAALNHPVVSRRFIKRPARTLTSLSQS